MKQGKEHSLEREGDTSETRFADKASLERKVSNLLLRPSCRVCGEEHKDSKREEWDSPKEEGMPREARNWW